MLKLAMLDEEPDATWAPELLDLEIVASARHLESQLGYVRRGEQPPAYPIDAPKVGAHWHVRDLERLLSFDQVQPRPLHRTIRRIIDAYWTDPMAVSLPMVRRLERESGDELRRDLRAAPTTAAEYQERIRALVLRPWMGDHACSIPRGWLPICERAVAIGEAAIPAPERVVSRTTYLTERFSRLEWIVSPRNSKMRTLHVYTSMSTGHACMGCGSPGKRDEQARSARILTLCSRHRKLRRADAEAFRQALFPGTPPDVPDMKL